MRNWKSTVLAAVVAGTGLAGSAMAAPSLTGLDGSLDSSLFTYKYEGDALPTDPSYSSLGFVLTASGGIDTSTIGLGTNSGVDYLRIDTDTNSTANDAYWYGITGGTSTSWDPNYVGGFTAEFRAIVRAANSGTYGAAFRFEDPNSSGLFQFWNNKVSGDLSSVSTTDNSDTWHTFRIASYTPDGSSAGQIYKVWRDGVEIGTFAQNTDYSGPLLAFGDYVSGAPEVNIDIDYLRWTTEGAYSPAPVPEPSTAMGLLLAGSGLMLRRRKESR
ncbi:MAG: PEP-CTERM sorting domain-containing protein [Phycisphaerales bacterium]|nr:PEP-CTERM sorting domain-containing protein [Phycisphaerales bacterium]